MTMPIYKIRIIGNACIKRYDSGEGTIDSIIDSYNLAADDRAAVVTHIQTTRPDIPFA